MCDDAFDLSSYRLIMRIMIKMFISGILSIKGHGYR